MTAITVRLVREGDDQIIELPDEVAFADGVRQVKVVQMGASRLLVPIRSRTTRAGSGASE